MSRGKRALGIFAAMNGVGCGVGLFLQCGLGSDPIGILCDGISRSLGIQFGNASLLYNAIVIVLALIVAKRNMGAGTIVYALTSGYFIDFYSWLFSPLQLGEQIFAVKLLVYLIGELLFAFALALLIRFELGMNALDALLYKLEEKTSVKYSVLRTGTDFLYTVTGFLLGGVFGIGTVLSILFTGTLVGWFVKLELPKQEQECRRAEA